VPGVVLLIQAASQIRNPLTGEKTMYSKSKTSLALSLIVCLAFFALSFAAQRADDTSLSPRGEAVVQSSPTGGGAMVDLTPTLDITIQHSHPMHSMSITADDNYYYMMNGGNAGLGRVLTYDLNGNFVDSVAAYLDGRAIFYNPNDGTVYVKTYLYDLYWVDPTNGNSGLVYSGIFHDSQSHVSFDPSTQYMYEHYNGTVYVVDLANGNTINTMSGFQYGGWGFHVAIATDGQHIFTWDETQVHAYDMSGNYQESFSLDYGSYGYSLSWANNRMFAADDAAGGTGYWYGYTFADVFMTCGNLTPVICRGKFLYFVLTVTNNSGGNIAGTLAFSGYAGYGCDPGNVLVAIRRAKTYPVGVTTAYYFFKVPNSAAPGQYSTSVGGTLSGYDLFCCMNTDIIQCQPWRIGENTEWELVEAERPEVGLPTVSSLVQNYPNPFNANTNISFSLAEAGNVSLKVYDITGRLVTTLVEGQMDAGEHVVSWDASNVSSGVYFYKLATADYSATKSMNLLK
jgi:hypothetical protein